MIYESEIISEKEKKDIIVDVDKDFSKSFEMNVELSEMSTQRSGLLQPFLISLLTIIITLILFLIFEMNTTSRIEESIKLSPVSTSETEWAILQKYKNDAEFALSEKNAQISIYKSRIIDYDNRLREIRELITIKKDIEILVDNERNKLIEEGRSSDEIKVVLERIENSQIAGISEELKEEYNTSITELNNKIDKILEQKTENELRLKETVAQRDVIEARTIELKKAAEAAVSPSENIPGITADRLDNETEIFYKYFNGKVNELISAMETGKYADGITEIEKLISGLDSENSTIKIADSEKEAYISILNFLKNTAKEKALGAADSNQDDMKEIFALSNFLKVNTDSTGSTAEEVKLRRLIAEIPEIAEAFNVLSAIDKSRWLKEYAGNTSAVAGKISEAATVSTTPAVQGVITNIQFNKITMRFDSSKDLKVGDSFSIIKNGESIGNGNIAKISTNEITGRIISLSNPKIKPDAGDIVRIDI